MGKPIRVALCVFLTLCGACTPFEPTTECWVTYGKPNANGDRIEVWTCNGPVPDSIPH